MPRWAPAADGLGGIAVSAVLVGVLLGRGIPGNPVALSTLLALSGYLVTCRMAGESRQTGSLAIVSLWRRRSARWIPTLWILLAVVALGSVLRVWPEFQLRELPAETASAFFNVSNWYRLSQAAPLQDALTTPLGHLWFTSVVEQTLFVWCAVFAGAFMLHRRGWSFAVPVAISVLAGFSLLSLWFSAAEPATATLHSGVRLAEVLMGSSLAWFWRRRGTRGPRRPELRRFVLLAWPPALAVLVFMAVFVDATSSIWSYGGFLVTGAAATAVIAGAVTAGGLREFLEAQPLVWFGRRSGVAFLVAWPVYTSVPTAWGPIVSTVIVLAVVALSVMMIDRLPDGLSVASAKRIGQEGGGNTAALSS